MERRDELLRRAREVRQNAHAPYSGFHVGAAILAEDGTIHVGCNVENASYGLTLCAERGALSAAIATGRCGFRMIAVSTSGNEPVAPCGACRQALAEFARDRLLVVSEASGRVSEWLLAELLPEPFVEMPSSSGESS